MMKAPCLALLMLLTFSYSSFSQEYSYTHYDIGNGLAGSTVYSITQDKDGFIWTGTEAGVSRFDGTHFKNLTTADGLPDIEILQIFGDSKGRVWMAPFRNSVCYFFKGKIHNQDNDTLLHRIHLTENIENFAEDDRGNILIQEKTALHLVTDQGNLKEYDTIDNRPIRESVGLGRSKTGHFWVQAEDKIYDLSDGGFTAVASIFIPAYIPNFISMSPSWVVWRDGTFRSAIRSMVTGHTINRPFGVTRYLHITFSLIDDSLIFSNGIDGTTEYDISTGRTKRFLPGRKVSRTFRDASGSLWFTTLDQGIFRLNSDEFRTINLSANMRARTSVWSIRRIGHELLIGNDYNCIYHLSLPDYTLRTISFTQGNNKILFVDTLENDNVMMGTDAGFSENKARDLLRIEGLAIPIKSVLKEKKDRLLLCTTVGAILFDPYRFRIIDTLLHERSVTACFRNDTTYVGTSKGLYRINPDKSTVFLGNKIPFLRKRISSIAFAADNILWVGSFDDAGVVGIRNDSLVASITKKKGLTSGVCRTLLIHNKILWVGTAKGLNKIELNKPGYPVTRYTSNDGLGSDIINVIYADSSNIYVGTPAGLCYFNESQVDVTEACRLYLLALINGGIDRIGDSSHLSLSYKDNGLRFEFAGISYRSVDNITYKYRLDGLDSNWKETKETYLEYPTLPSGKYKFQLQAINKFGIQSRLLSLPFLVETPFWSTPWFYGLILAVFVFLIWLLVSLWVRNIRMRQNEKEQLAQRMSELEQKALRAQMNPHFIFNCLNSIQQYIFDQDIIAANKYITGFARLIRATLNNSTLAFIPLADEIDFLSAYLSLEKLRFKEKMDYSIRADPSIDTSAFSIPPMLVQPFVENSMRHGLRHKTDGKGYIQVSMEQTADGLTITIEDNGIGRLRAARYKTGEHIEYQSRGMSMTADRIRIINSTYGCDIRVEISDLEDEWRKPAGTRVIMRFPLFYKNLQKNDL
jgi:ligand-binding sensor domain-containing protein